MEGFAGVRVKLGSHGFPLLVEVQWRQDGAKGAALLFLVPPFDTFLGPRSVGAPCHCCAEAPDPIPAYFQPNSNCPPQVPWEYPPCMCLILSSQDGSCCGPINAYLALDSCRWRNPNTPDFRDYSLEWHGMRC